MAILSFRQKKYIEDKIRNYHNMKGEIEQWRQSVITGNRSAGASVRRKSVRASDPTGAVAIRLASPPERIRNMELWVESIDAAMRVSEGYRHYGIFRGWYWGTDECMSGVSSRTVRENRLKASGIVAHMAELRGIFDATRD